MVCTKVLSSIERHEGGGKTAMRKGGGGQNLEFALQQVSVGGHV